MKKLKVCTLFSGYDSQCIALDQIGIDYELVAWAEIEPNAIKAHNALYPQWADRNLGDVSKIDWNNTYFGINLLTYSFPCTNISTAGIQAGAVEGSGTASSLLWECRRVIDIKRPKYLLMENVRNLLGKRHKEVFDKWCKTLEDFGYKNFYQIMNAEDYGVPQHRERVIMVSILCTEDDPNPYFEFPQPTELECEAVDYLEDTDDETYYLDQRRLEQLLDELRDESELKGNKSILGWVRDHKGKVLYRYPRKTMNAVTTFVGGGFGNTTPYVLEYETE